MVVDAGSTSRELVSRYLYKRLRFPIPGLITPGASGGLQMHCLIVCRTSRNCCTLIYGHRDGIPWVVWAYSTFWHRFPDLITLGPSGGLRMYRYDC